MLGCGGETPSVRVHDVSGEMETTRGTVPERERSGLNRFKRTKN